MVHRLQRFIPIVMVGARTDHPFSLTGGGPWLHVLMRCHLVDQRGRVRGSWLALAAWLPIAIAAVVQLVIAGRVDPILSDPTMHVRLLVTVPLLVVAENLLETDPRWSRHAAIDHSDLLRHVRDHL